MIPSITSCAELAGKRVLVRADLNAPLKDGKVVNDFRIRKALPTIQFLKDKGARVVVISHTSHVGGDANDTLTPVYDALRTHLSVLWGGDILSKEAAEAVAGMQDGEVVLMENIRRYAEEKGNDPRFAEQIATLGDIYVNDAFADSHREHATIVGIPRHLPSYAGLLLLDEVSHLLRARTPETPGLFILGGAKFDTKMPLIEHFIDTYDTVFVGGALANDFFKARGYEVGVSLVSDIDLRESPLLNHPHVLLPVDVTVSDASGAHVVRKPTEVLPTDNILDAGPETVNVLVDHIRSAKTVLWNGPLGDYERGFSEQTMALARAVADADGVSIIGGGDTIASIEDLKLADSFTFLSTGGGAMLTFLEHGTLPGIDALIKE